MLGDERSEPSVRWVAMEPFMPELIDGQRGQFQRMFAEGQFERG